MTDRYVNRGRLLLVTGGARSGKSVLAERFAAEHGAGLTYIATARADDAEMAARIGLHQARRGADCRTLEAPIDLSGALMASDGPGVRLVDCLTVWLANVMFADRAPADCTAAVGELVKTLRMQKGPVVLVTNELGQGIVPADAATRAYRDAHGAMNQAVAAIADEVWMAVCGLPLCVKPGKEME